MGVSTTGGEIIGAVRLYKLGLGKRLIIASAIDQMSQFKDGLSIKIIKNKYSSVFQSHKCPYRIYRQLNLIL